MNITKRIDINITIKSAIYIIHSLFVVVEYSGKYLNSVEEKWKEKERERETSKKINIF